MVYLKPMVGLDSMSKKIYKWIIAGPGGIATSMYSDMKKTGKVHISGVLGSSEEKSQAAAKAFGAQRSFATTEDLQEWLLSHSSEVDALYIATPHSSHYDLARIGLEAGIPVLCEKPLTHNSHLTRSLVNLANQQQVLLMEALWSKFNPLIRKVWDFIDHGHLGDIRAMELRFGFPAPFDPNHRLFNPKLGGGAMLDLGIYPLWLPLAFWGEPYSIQVQGTIASTGVDEASLVLLGFRNGAMASCHTSLAYSLDNTAQIMGTKGRIVLEAPWFAPTKARYIPNPGTKDTKPEVWSIPLRGKGLIYQLEHFHGLLDQGATQSPIHSLQDTLLLSKVMDTIMANI